MTFAFLGFVLTLSFFTLSGISTKETYFERYKDVWDVMLSIKNADIDDVISTKLPEGVHDAVFYQKGETSIEITSNELSEEVLNISQIGEIAGIGLLNQRDTIELKASIVVMDDKSFDQYCRDSALEIRHDGIVIWNYCWNSVKSDFRHKEYVIRDMAIAS